MCVFFCYSSYSVVVVVAKGNFHLFSSFSLVCRSAEERKMSAPRVREDQRRTHTHTHTQTHLLWTHCSLKGAFAIVVRALPYVCASFFVVISGQESWRKFASFLKQNLILATIFFKHLRGEGQPQMT